MTVRRRCLPVALCVLALSCGGKKPEAPDKGATGGGTPAAVAATPTARADAQKGTYITSFLLGSASNPEGIVTFEARTFRVGEAVYTSFEIPNAPAGSKVRVAWALLPDKKPVSRQEAPLSPDKPAVAFKADSKSWPIGDYELEMFLAEPGNEDGKLMGTAPLKIVKERPK